VGVAEEELVTGQVAVGDADIADVAGPEGRVRLEHRLGSSDGFDHRVGAEPVGEILDPGGAVVAAFFDERVRPGPVECRLEGALSGWR
jgi:hypothetical protein